MKHIKKFIVILTIAALSVAALTACSETPATSGGNTNPPSENSTPQNDTDETAYEVTYTNAKVWKNSIGSTWVQTIVEITNTGSKNLHLSSGSYDLEDADGNLVDSRTLVSAFPDVLAPGEKGYMYEETTLEDYKGDNTLRVVARPDVEEASSDLVRYNITDVSVANDDMGDVNIMGRVENTTDEAGSMVYIVAFCYDASGTMIASAFTILEDDLKAGDKVGFKISSFSLPDDVTADKIANTVVYAYPNSLF